MIMEWKRQSHDSYHATWRGVQFLLFDNSATKRWHVLANGKLVKQNWHTARSAMEEFDRRQQKIILEAVKTLAPPPVTQEVSLGDTTQHPAA